MKKYTKSFLFAIFIFLPTIVLSSYGQEITTVYNKKVGKLSKVIKKNNISNVKYLKITGILNGDDLFNISNFENIEYLDLKDVVLSKEKEKEHKGYILSSGNLKLPLLKNVKELRLPLKCTTFDPFPANMTSLPSLKMLYIGQHCKVRSQSSEMLYLEKITIDTGAPIESSVDKRDPWGFSHSTEILVDTLVIPSLEYFSNKIEIFKQTLPYFVKTSQPERTILNKWNDNIDKDDLDKFSYFVESPFVKSPFAGTNITSIKIPKAFESIPKNYFKGCKKLETIILHDSIKSIGESAFEDCAIKSIDIPKSIQNMHFSAFKNCPIEELNFHSSNPPQIDDRILAVSDKGAIYLRKRANWEWDEDYNLNWSPTYKINIPANSLSAYNSQEQWNKMTLVELGSPKKISITIEKPGTILSLTSINALTSADSLIIKGYLYESDLKIIRQCNVLKYLDLSHTYITYSPEYLKERRADTEALSFVFGLIDIGLDNNYKDGKVTTNDYQANKALTYVLQSATEFNEPEKNCLIPQHAFENMIFLETVKLPLRAADIDGSAFKNCINLKMIDLPPYLNSINSEVFMGCKKLQSIILPPTIKYIGKNAFKDCERLEEIILPKNLRELDDLTFDGCKNLKKIVFPEGLTEIPYYCLHNCLQLKEIIIPSTITSIDLNWNNSRETTASIYFKSPIPPRVSTDFFNKGDRIHIPKGSMTAYYNLIGNTVKYIEE